MSKKIKHYTLNTGNMETFDITDVIKDIKDILKIVVAKGCTKEGFVGNLMNDGMTYKIDLVAIKKGYLFTLLFKVGNDFVPILESAGSNDSDEPYRELINISEKIGVRNKIKKTNISDETYVVDTIFPTSSLYLAKGGSMLWTGDFCKCMGFFLLYNEEFQ